MNISGKVFAYTALFAVVLIGLVSLWWYTVENNAQNNHARTTVEYGNVSQVIPISGVVTGETTGQLTFSTTGTIEQILVQEFATVEAGDVLARLDTRRVNEELREARAALRETLSQRQELLAGPVSESRDILDTTVATAEQDLARTVTEQAQLVANAQSTLLSTDLQATARNVQERSPAPTISGTYSCDNSGVYTFTIYRSNSESGFSMRVTGLEQDTVPISFNQTVPFGQCGLRAQFTEDLYYNQSVWDVAVPNTNSSLYITNHNAYQSALLTQENAITRAEEAVTLATQGRDRDTLSAREEQIERANAQIAQVEARIAQLAIREQDHTLRAPFAGTVTAVHSTIGEQAGQQPVVTLLGDNPQHELTARIPEVDITYIEVGQAVEAYFDARPTEQVNGTVHYIAPLPTYIDGVAYFEARIRLLDTPPWIRIGLNADVDLIIAEQTDTLRVPTSFLIQEGEETFVRTSLENGTLTPVTVKLRGTNGYTAIDGMSADSLIFSP